MLEIYFKTERDAAFQKIGDFRVGGLVYVTEANLEDLHKIEEHTFIDVADLRDSLDKYELPRLEPVGENLIFFVRHPSDREPGLYTETLTIALTSSFVFIISPTRSEIVEQFLSSSSPFTTIQRPKLLLHILLKITQEYTQSIKRLRHSIVGFDQTPLVVNSQTIISLTRSEEILNQYLIALVPLRNLLETLAGGRYIHFYEEDVDLLEDLMIATRQSEDVCRVNIKSIRSLRDSYHIIFTNDVNRTIKLLTALTIIFSIPTIIASIYGMNVLLPFQKKSYAFPLIMGLTAITSVLAILWFRRRRWF